MAYLRARPAQGCYARGLATSPISRVRFTKKHLAVFAALLLGTYGG
jgi:hypothetical protein